VVVTARPSYSRIKTALVALKDRPDTELLLVVAASALLDRYGNVLDVLQRDGFTPNARVYMVVEGENLATMAKTTGLGMMELSTVFDNLEPDAVVTIADRYETLATAAAAAYMNLPVVHIQGGEVTGSVDEKVRHAVTKLSNLHLVSTQASAERVVRMGETPESVHVTGCPSIDLAALAVDAPPITSEELYAHYGGVGPRVDLEQPYLVVMQHPVTTEYEAARRDVTETLRAIHQIGLPTLWFWPNVDAGSDGTSKGIRVYREEAKPQNIHFFRNLVPADFLRVLRQSRAIVGNSSVAIRECSYLGVPAVNVGTRQDGRERGQNVVDVPYDSAAIQRAVAAHLEHGHFPADTLYGQGRAGELIAELLGTAPLTIDKRLTY
jgi:UDP-hydrolysing UDP-N-acetyl-D-glucosamine 2-epimerase